MVLATPPDGYNQLECVVYWCMVDYPSGAVQHRRRADEERFHVT
jgi:hypothetical protein